MSVIDEVWKVVVDPAYIPVFRERKDWLDQCLPIVTQSVGGLLVPLGLFNEVMHGTNSHAEYYKRATTLYTNTEAQKANQQFQAKLTDRISVIPDNQPCQGCEHICTTCIK